MDQRRACRRAGVLTIWWLAVGGLVGAQGVPVVPAAARSAVEAQSLSELESAYVVILQLRIAYARLLAEADGCRAQLGPLRAKAATLELTEDEAGLKAKVEAGHPGFTWDPKSGAFSAVAKQLTHETPPLVSPPAKK